MRQDNNSSFFNGICISFGLHFVLAMIAIVALERKASTALQNAEIFTVTLEGGENLGGIAQLPKGTQNKVLTKQEEVKNQPKEEEEKEEKKEAKKEILEKKKEVSKQKVILDKKSDEEDKKIKDKVKEEANKKKEKEKRDRQLTDTLKKLKNQYEGESGDAGAHGFGASALGGRSMGGGTLASLEKVAYSNALQKHVKAGWHWLGGADKLWAKVKANILPNGEVQNVEVTYSSGNGNFDDSIARAVLKASPVPPAPESIYSDFAVVIFTFDSTE